MAESLSADAQPADAIDRAGDNFGSRTLRRMLAAFTYRDFRVQWFGACTSSVGTWTQITAQNWLVLSLTGSAFFLGLDAFLQQLPIMLFTLIGGVLADRLDRRRTLLTSQYMQMATALTLAAARLFRRRQDLAHPGPVVHDRPRAGVRRSGVSGAHSSLVDKKDLPNAVALNSIQFNIARVLGPLVFGATITAFAKWGFSDAQGMAACFVLNALSFLVVIYALMSLHVKHIPHDRHTRMRDEMRGGLAYVRHHGSLVALIVLAAATTFLGFAVLTFLPIFAQESFTRAPGPTASCWRFRAPARWPARSSSRGSESSSGWG